MLPQPPPPRARQPHDGLLRALRRHPFFLGALVVHAVVLGALSQLHSRGLAEATLRVNQAQIQVHTQAAAQRGMRRRVDSLKAMKSLMERIARAQAEAGMAEDLPEAGDASQPLAPDAQAAPTANPSPQDLLAQARDLHDSIQRIEQAAQAKKMAEVLKITPEQALERLQQQVAQDGRRLPTADAARPQTTEQVIQALSQYEQQAQESLSRLQAQHAQAHQGTAVHTADQAAGSASGGASEGANPVPSGEPGWADGRRSTVKDADLRRYDGQQRSPTVDTRQLRLAAGNSLGPGGVWSNRIYVDRWYLIGPFPAANASSMNRIYPPEQWVDLDGVYLGKGQRVLRWQYVSSAAYPLTPPDYAEAAIYYGYTEITSDRARDVVLALGADDDARLWLNDRPVWTSGNQRKAWYTQGGVQSLKQDIQNRNLIEDRLRVSLRKGRNTVLFKLYNNPLDVFFSMQVEPLESGG